MAITRFQDLPSENTPINSTNLNGNFDELGVKVGTSIDNNYRTNIIKSKNLFNANAILSGYELTDNGASIGTNPAWYVSEYIEVKPNTSYYLSATSKTYGSSNAFYDISKTFLSSQSAITGIITTPANAKYVRFNGRLSELDGVQLEEGSTATTYEPYIRSIVVDNEEIYNKNMMDTLESLKPYILYESSSGVSTGSITLNDSKDNYKYMEVFCERSGLRTSHKFIVSSSNTSTYALPMIGTDSSQLIIRTIGFTLSGTTLTITINNRTNIATNSTTFTPNANQLNIVMVIGYK